MTHVARERCANIFLFFFPAGKYINNATYKNGPHEKKKYAGHALLKFGRKKLSRTIYTNSSMHRTYYTTILVRKIIYNIVSCNIYSDIHIRCILQGWAELVVINLIFERESIFFGLCIQNILGRIFSSQFFSEINFNL